MKNIATILFCLLLLNLKAQINPILNKLVINVTANVDNITPGILLNWNNSTASGTGHTIHKKLQENTQWNFLKSLSVSDTSYFDDNINIGKVYEYRIVKTNSNNGVVSWGYTSSGIQVLPDLRNKGLLLVLDSSIANQLIPEIEQFKSDLKAEAYFVEEIMVDRYDEVASVKDKIINAYNNSAINYNTMIIVGNVPVPYSGDLNPDAHTNHKGAWPTDLFYADIDGVWTDITVNNTSGSDPRTVNIPGDGKYDQSIVPSTLEMEVGRIDFHSMSLFGESELQLLSNYLNKNHEFRHKMFVPGRKALMDEGGFVNTTAGEGFGQSAPRAMVPLLGKDSLILGDYFTVLSKESHLWSYGQGGGSYTSCNGVGTTKDFDTIEVQSIFTMLFGSYFGDYDKPNNLMRAALGSGTVLTCSWSSARPVWYYHHMAMGQTIGFSAKRSANLRNMYFFINFGPDFPANNGIHNVLLGDPSLRAFYVKPPSELDGISNNNGIVDLNWNASDDADVMGYNLYRTEDGVFDYVKVNNEIIPLTHYTDSLSSGNYTYFLRAVKLETTASGSYFNESLGLYEDIIVDNTVGYNQLVNDVNLSIYPNPVAEVLHIESDIPIQKIKITDLKGSIIGQYNASSSLDISSFPSGVYLLQLQTNDGVIKRKIIKK